MSHSGRERLYIEFVDTISDPDFIAGVRAIDNWHKPNDSKIKNGPDLFQTISKYL